MHFSSNWQYIARYTAHAITQGRAHAANCLSLLRQADLPYDCCLCREPEPRGGLCETCRRLLPLNTRHCSHCGIPLFITATALSDLPGPCICPDCGAVPPPYRQAIVPLLYRFPVDYMIGQFKYAGDIALGRVLGEILGAAIQAQIKHSKSPPEIIVPIPQPSAKLSKRGFNQAFEISRFVSGVTGIPVDNRLLRRRTGSIQASASYQRQRSRSTRLKLNKQGFVCSARTNRRLLLIDDVMTTGTTLSAAAAVMQAAGAPAVDVAAIARTQLD